MSKFLNKTVILSLSLLCVSPVLVGASSKKVTFADIQKIKTCIEVKLWNTGLTGVFALDPLKWGVKYEMPVASSVVDAKWKTEFTISDAVTATQWVGQLASYALIDSALSTNTWAGEKVALLSSYVLAKKDIREKIVQLVALKKQTPTTTAQKREQISKILALQEEITKALGC